MSWYIVAGVLAIPCTLWGLYSAHREAKRRIGSYEAAIAKAKTAGAVDVLVQDLVNYRDTGCVFSWNFKYAQQVVRVGRHRRNALLGSGF